MKKFLLISLAAIAGSAFANSTNLVNEKSDASGVYYAFFDQPWVAGPGYCAGSVPYVSPLCNFAVYQSKTYSCKQNSQLCGQYAPGSSASQSLGIWAEVQSRYLLPWTMHGNYATTGTNTPYSSDMSYVPNSWVYILTNGGQTVLSYACISSQIACSINNPTFAGSEQYWLPLTATFPEAWVDYSTLHPSPVATANVPSTKQSGILPW